MALKAVVDKIDDIPEQYRDLYSERNGKWELTGVEGVKTQADIDRLSSALEKERNDHKQTRASLTAWGDLKPDDTIAKLDRMGELEAAAAGKIDDKKIEDMVEARVKSRLAPVERDLIKTKTDLVASQGEVTNYKQREKTTKIHETIRRAGSAAKLLDTAIEDAIVLGERVFDVNESGDVVTKDNSGVTPGVGPDVWLTDMQQKRPHWWPASAGGGANGGGGGSKIANNPFSAEHWNLTEQGKLVNESPAKADQYAKAAGTKVGGPRPQAKKAA